MVTCLVACVKDYCFNTVTQQSLGQSNSISLSLLTGLFSQFIKTSMLHDNFQEAILSASQAEVDLSRDRVSAFLSSHTAYELLPESGKVFIV